MSDNPNSPSHQFSDQDLDRLMASLTLMGKIESLSDSELADLVVNRVWGRLSLGTEEEFLINELITRFELRVGIERNDDGEIVKGGWKS